MVHQATCKSRHTNRRLIGISNRVELPELVTAGNLLPVKRYFWILLFETRNNLFLTRVLDRPSSSFRFAFSSIENSVCLLDSEGALFVLLNLFCSWPRLEYRQINTKFTVQLLSQNWTITWPTRGKGNKHFDRLNYLQNSRLLFQQVQ